MDRIEFRRIRDLYWKELARCGGSIERLYAETSNRYTATLLTATSKDTARLNQLEDLLTIIEGELAAAYMRERGWELDQFWKKKDEAANDL